MSRKVFRENEGIPAGLLALLALIAGITVANLYYNQPLLGMIARDLGVSEFTVNQIPMITQVGYAAGLLFLVPLGDMCNPRKLWCIQFTVLILALLIISCARHFPLVLAASFLTGVCSVIPQMFVPIASQLSTPSTKGRNIGIVISGLLVGILVSRVISGLIGEYFGWRTMYGLAALLMIFCFIAVWRGVPDLPSTFRGRYTELMRSVWDLIRTYPLLRVASLRAAFGFSSFLAFWTTLAFHMEQPPFFAGSDITGLLGLCGVFGAMTASLVGRFVKKVGENRFHLIGCILFIISWSVFYWQGFNYVGMIGGIILIDIAMQCLQMSNQVTVLSLEQGASNRLNTVFMTTYFMGGALGTLLGGAAWTAWGWSGVASTGIVLVLISLTLHFSYLLKKTI